MKEKFDPFWLFASDSFLLFDFDALFLFAFGFLITYPNLQTSKHEFKNPIIVLILLA